jgi:hypothetical protein
MGTHNSYIWLLGLSASFKNLNDTKNGNRKSSAKEVFPMSSHVGTNLIFKCLHHVLVFDANAFLHQGQENWASDPFVYINPFE